MSKELESDLNNYFDELLHDASMSEASAKSEVQVKIEANTEAKAAVNVKQRVNKAGVPTKASEQQLLSEPLNKPLRAMAKKKAATNIHVKPHAEPESVDKQKLQALLDRRLIQSPVEASPKAEANLDAIQVQQAQAELEVSKSQCSELSQTENIEPSVTAEVEVSELAQQDPVVSQQADHSVQWCENGRPAWAQERFDALLFDVAGLKLAVPLIALGQIVPMHEGLNHLFGQSSWFMGVLKSSMGNLRVVNTALFVMPERYEERFLECAEFAISLHGVPWALAVDTVHQPISLEPDEIKWRSERSKRPWLAGTVKSSMCALLDIPQMAHLLVEADDSLSFE